MEGVVARAQLVLERVDPSDSEGRALVGRFVGVSLEVPDVLATYERLVARGVDFVEPPEKQAWGGMLAHLRDPDGNVITLVGTPKSTLPMEGSSHDEV